MLAATASKPLTQTPCRLFPKTISKALSQPSCTVTVSATRGWSFSCRPCSQSLTALFFSPRAACCSASSEDCRPRKLCNLLRAARSEEHTSELQSRGHLVCRLLLEKKNQ